VLRTRHGALPTTDPFRRLWLLDGSSERKMGIDVLVGTRWQLMRPDAKLLCILVFLNYEFFLDLSARYIFRNFAITNSGTYHTAHKLIVVIR